MNEITEKNKEKRTLYNSSSKADLERTLKT